MLGRTQQSESAPSGKWVKARAVQAGQNKAGRRRQAPLALEAEALGLDACYGANTGLAGLILTLQQNPFQASLLVSLGCGHRQGSAGSTRQPLRSPALTAAPGLMVRAHGLCPALQPSAHQHALCCCRVASRVSPGCSCIPDGERCVAPLPPCGIRSQLPRLPPLSPATAVRLVLPRQPQPAGTHEPG